jgi:transposase-like protein
MEATMTAPSTPVHAGGMNKPDPEVPERPARRRFAAGYKLRILAEADQAPAGTISAILRREGIYSSQLATWRAQRKEGSLAGLSTKRGPKPDPVAAENTKLRRENEKLRKDLADARLVIDVQKKVALLLQHEPGEVI